MIYQLLIISLIPFLSGLLAYNSSLKKSINVQLTLSFSGAYLLGICFLHLLPDLFHYSESNVSFYILIGFFLQLILDYFSGGIEHGHTHVNHKKLGKFPWLVLLSLCFHAFLEALPIHHVDHQFDHGNYFLGILVHKAPIAFVLASLLIAYQLKKHEVLITLAVFSLIAPLGIYLGTLLSFDTELFSKLYALSIGIILHLSTTILLETNEEHKVQWKKLLPLILGAGLAALSSIVN